MHMKNQESVLKVSVLLSVAQTVAALTVDVEVLFNSIFIARIIQIRLFYRDYQGLD